jgi:hypothetical protein
MPVQPDQQNGGESEAVSTASDKCASIELPVLDPAVARQARVAIWPASTKRTKLTPGTVLVGSGIDSRSG